jgi:cysteine-rich repeat protein
MTTQSTYMPMYTYIHTQFAVVVTGSMSPQSSCPTPTCPSSCSNHGSCVSASCVCDAGFFGPTCGVSMPQIVSGRSFSVSVSSSRWSYYAFNIDSGITSWSLSFTGTGDPNYYVARDRIPTLTDADLRATSVGASATLTPASVIPGVYVLGIRAYCCADATAVVTLTTTGTSKCGNGVVDVGEACDDGNTASGDGCTWFCQVER